MAQIIAELCQNHLGDISRVEKMVAAAANSGASAVKIQTIFANDLAFRPQFEQGLSVDGNIKCIKRPYESEYNRLKSLELTFQQMKHFIEIAKEHNVNPMTTCFTRQHVEKMYEIGFKHIKIASYDCASLQLLREVSSKFDFILVSTGATYDDEIKSATEILSNSRYALLHCVTLYPTPLQEFHLSRMKFLQQFTENVGLSDHSNFKDTGIIASAAAIHLGAKYIERHFTILPSDETKDGPVSITPEGLKELSRFCDLSYQSQKDYLDKRCPDWNSKLIGSPKRTLSSAELLNRDYYRGRFASHYKDQEGNLRTVFNWEETEIQ